MGPFVAVAARPMALGQVCSHRSPVRRKHGALRGCGSQTDGWAEGQVCSHRAPVRRIYVGSTAMECYPFNVVVCWLELQQ